MAEILAIVAFPIAAYETIQAFYKAGKAIHQRIQTYKDAPEIVVKVKEFVKSIHDGDLQVQIEVTEWLFQQPDVRDSLKDNVSTLLKQLKTELVDIDKSLLNLFDSKGELKRVGFTIHNDKKRLAKCMSNLKTWKDEFWREISIIDMMKRNVQDPLLLTSPDVFMPQFGEYDIPIEGSPITRGNAEIRESKDPKIPPRPVTVLIEKLHDEGNQGLPEVQVIAVELAKILYKPNRGILKCLGYRPHDPAVELVFEFPSGFDNPMTLRSLLWHSAKVKMGYQCPLDYRFRLAKEIGDTVLSVHTAGYVHKNIRPDSIMLFSKTKQPLSDDKPQIIYDDLSSACLTDWKFLRKSDALTEKRGDLDWTKNLYRHNDRQGIKLQKRYEMKHDVYSLGVCLLEIGLWQCFIVERNGEKQLSDFFMSAALQCAPVNESDFANLPALCASETLQAVLVAIAKQLLPQCMGTAYKNLVVSCLTNVEGGFGDKKLFEGDEIVAALNFKNLVLEAAPNISSSGVSVVSG